MASEALGFPSTSFMNHSSSSIYNLLGISARVYVFFFHSFSTIQAETYASLPGFCNMPCFHRRHLAQRSDECLQLHSTRYGKSGNLWTFTHVDLANFGNGRNSWRQWPTLYVVALFTIFQYISYILLDLFVPCSVFEWFQNPIMNTGYLQVLTPSETFWMLQHVPKDYCQRLEDLPLDFFSQPWRSASILTAFWAMSSWLCVVRHGAADGAPNSPKWHRWKLPKNWALSSLQSTCLLPLWEMYSKPGYFMISRKHGAMQPRYLDFCQETIQEMVFHDCSPSLHPLIRCMESSLIHWDGTVTINHWD